MKKTYMQPAMMQVKTKAEMMICVSYNPATNSNPTQEQGDGSNALSKRRRGIFDSDEPEAASNGIW